MTQLRAMIERSPAMLAQRKACALIQRKQGASHGGASLFRAEQLMAILKDKHSDQVLEQFAAGKTPDAFQAGTLAEAWSAYLPILVDAVNEPASALRQAMQAPDGDEQAGEAGPACDALAALAASIKGMGSLDDPTSIAAAAQSIKKELARIRSLYKNTVGSALKPWGNSKSAGNAAPPEPDPETTPNPTKEDKPPEQVTSG